MPRPSKGPRLYLRAARPGRDRLWVIRDGSIEVGTGCRETDRGQAEKALAAYLADKHAPTTAPKAPARLLDVLIADVLAVYLAEKAPLTRSADWIGFMVTPVNEAIGGKPLSSVNATLCSQYVTAREEFVSTATARHELKVLRAAIRYYHASQFGPLPSVPVVTLPPKKRPRVDYLLTREQLAQRLRAARRMPQMKHLPSLLLIGWYTGTRPGSILKLRWVPTTDGGWFDLENGVLHRLGSEEQETRKRAPPAKIHSLLLPHLRRWRDADMAKGITHAVHYYGKPLQKLRNSWRSVAIAAGHAEQTGTDEAGKPVWKVSDGPHIMRHSAVTWLLRDKVAPFEVAGFVGMDLHALIETYDHHSPDFQSNAANAHGRRTSAPVSPQKPSLNAVNVRNVASINPRKA